MRKWTYLVATLLMAGTTATFTGCIDTDEPAGITELRGAKSELIKAQAAVKLVEVEWQKAQVANQELQNAALEISNKAAEIRLQLEELNVQMRKLQVEAQEATTAEAKARAEAEIARLEVEKTEHENRKALLAEQFKADMILAEEATARAQETYRQAMEAIEAGKLLLSDGEKDIIEKAQERFRIASDGLDRYYGDLKTARDDYYNTLVNPNLPTLASLQAELKLAQLAVEKKEILLNEKNNMLALAEDFDAAAWDDKILDLKKKKSEYESEKSKAEVEIATIKTSADYKAAAQKVTEKAEARRAAQDANDKAVADSTTQANTPLDIAAYKSEPINEGLKTLFDKSDDFSFLSGYNAGVFSYPAVQYTQTQYNADLKIEDVTARTSSASSILKRVNAWIDALGKYAVDENGKEWNKLILVEKEKEAKNAKAKFEKDSVNWDISVKAVKGTPTTVPTTELKKVTDAYNSSYAAVEFAVKAYNSAWDAVYQAAYDAAVEREKASVLERAYRENMIAALSPDSKEAWEALKPAEQTTSKLEAILGDTVKQAKAKADANNTLAEWLKLKPTVAYLADKGKEAGEQALANDKEEKVKKALEALDEAARKAQTAVGKVEPAILGDYVGLAATPYGQILAEKVSVEEMTGKGDFYKKEEKDKKPTGHMQVLRSDISAEEFAKLSKTKLDHATASKALTHTSEVAFGNLISSEGGRLVEVTESMVRAYIKQHSDAGLAGFGALGAMIAANDDVQTCKDMIAAADLIKPLKAQMEGVLADLNAEINTNTALMDPFIAKADETRIALKTAKEEEEKAQEEQDALTAEAEANKDKFDELIRDYDDLIGVVQGQIDGINNGAVSGPGVTVESVLNYWKNEVAIQEGLIEKAKLAVTAAEKRIELFNKGEYKESYVIEQKKLALETAQEEYDVAKAIYDTALAQVKSVLETLSK